MKKKKKYAFCHRERALNTKYVFSGVKKQNKYFWKI